MASIKYLLLLSAFSASALLAQAPLKADAAHFVINEGNHAVGRSDFSIQPVKQGSITTPAAYSVATHGNVSLENTKYSFSGSGSLDKNLDILQENLNGTINGSAVTFDAQNSGSDFVINISADGRNYRNSLKRPANPTIFFPDFDLSSYEVLLQIVASRPGTALSALIPKQTGILSAATVASQADVQATLNGKTLAVHHTSMTIGPVTSELYYSAANQILEVDIPSQAFAIVRDKFKLQPPPPPPPSASPNSQQQPNDQPPPPQ